MVSPRECSNGLGQGRFTALLRLLVDQRLLPVLCSRRLLTERGRRKFSIKPPQGALDSVHLLAERRILFDTLVQLIEASAPLPVDRVR